MPLLSRSQVPCGLDNSFSSGGQLLTDIDRHGDHVQIQSDGKVLIACNPSGNANTYIKRLNVDGSVDMTYGINGMCSISVAEISSRITDMVLYNNQLYAAGVTTTYIGGAKTYPFVAVVSGNGALMSGFGTNGVKVISSSFSSNNASLVVANSHIYISGNTSLPELFVASLDETTGNFDLGFDTDGILNLSYNPSQEYLISNDIQLDKTNQLVLTGKKYRAYTSSLPDFSNTFIARVSTSGVPDMTFGSNGILAYSSGSLNLDEGRSIHVLPDNDYIVCGSANDGDFDFSVLRVKHNGMVDASFGNNGWRVYDLNMNNENDNPFTNALLPDGRILMSGNIIAGDTLYFALLMLQANGTPDPGFATNGLFKTVFGTYNSNNGRGMALSQDGKIVMAGWAYTNVNATCTQKYMAVSRYLGGSMATAVHDMVTNEGLLLYPNPISANRIFYLDESWGNKVTSLSLFDLNGTCVYTKEGNNHTYILPSSLHAGIYCCRIKTVSGFIVEKLMVE